MFITKNLKNIKMNKEQFLTYVTSDMDLKDRIKKVIGFAYEYDKNISQFVNYPLYATKSIENNKECSLCLMEDSNGEVIFKIFNKKNIKLDKAQGIKDLQMIHYINNNNNNNNSI